MTITASRSTARIVHSYQFPHRAVGSDGSVQDAYWYENANWQRFELAPTGRAAETAGITAVSRIPGSMELWWMD